jgi:hypothetical protein
MKTLAVVASYSRPSSSTNTASSAPTALAARWAIWEAMKLFDFSAAAARNVLLVMRARG